MQCFDLLQQIIDVHCSSRIVFAQCLEGMALTGRVQFAKRLI